MRRDQSDKSDRSDASRLVQFVQYGGKFAGGVRDIFFFENAFVIARTDFDINTACGKAAPAHLIVEGADERVAARPKENNASVIRLRLVLEPCLDVGAPEFAFVLRPFRKV